MLGRQLFCFQYDVLSSHTASDLLLYLQNAQQLAQLASSARNPGKCLSAVRPDNLVKLMRRAEPTVALDLAAFIVQHRVHIDVQDAINPYYTAVWVKLCHDAAISSHADLLTALAGTAATATNPGPEAAAANGESDQHQPSTASATSSGSGGSGSNVLASSQQLLLAALLWANSYAHDMAVTCLDPLERSLLLRSVLVHASCCCGASQQEVTSLWSGRMGGLLRPDVDGLGDHRRGVPLGVVQQVVLGSRQEAMHWPALVRALWRIAHCRAVSLNDINSMWRECPALLMEQWEAAGPDSACFSAVSKPPVHPGFVLGILAAGAGLDPELQYYILTSNTEIPAEVSSWGVELLRYGINRLQSSAELKLVSTVGGATLPNYVMRARYRALQQLQFQCHVRVWRKIEC